ncbi:MAG: hypothetical protein JSV81_20290 [Anaerolineales bacterium]|nr:MAG: hypothetical protein JSV81_20290 [Anaerolineales bacterium]
MGLVTGACFADLAGGCDVTVVCSDWNVLKHLDMARIRKVVRQPFIVGGRNLYEPDELKRLGFTYRGVGRGYYGRDACQVRCEA